MKKLRPNLLSQVYSVCHCEPGAQRGVKQSVFESEIASLPSVARNDTLDLTSRNDTLDLTSRNDTLDLTSRNDRKLNSKYENYT